MGRLWWPMVHKSLPEARILPTIAAEVRWVGLVGFVRLTSRGAFLGGRNGGGYGLGYGRCYGRGYGRAGQRLGRS